MQRILQAALLGMAFLIGVAWPSVADAQQRAATAVFAYLDSARMSAVRVSDECYIPLDHIGEIGWTFTLGKGTADIRAEDRLFRVQLRQVRGETMFPLSAAAAAMGASLEWDGDLCRVFAHVTAVKSKAGEFELRTSIPVRGKLHVGEDARSSIEIIGARLAPDAEQDLVGSSIERTRGGLSVALEPSRPLAYDTIPDDRNSLFRLRFQPLPGEEPVEPVAPPAEVVTARAITPGATAGPAYVNLESDLAALVLVPLKGKLSGPVAFRRPELNIVEVVLPGAELLPTDGPLKSASITRADVRAEGGVAVLTLELSRPMGIELSSTPGQVAIQLLKPRVGDGKLAGKTIVVDPGHGGNDSGAKGADGTFEKTLNLNISRLISQELARHGATVIMTRNTDVFLPLAERPAIANRNNAHLFVSVHINSSAVANKNSGTITFYHRQDPIGQLLAEAIHRELVKVSGLPNVGVWSDSRIYRTGFAVLRGAKMPGVLLELGFINNVKDRERMKTPQFQKASAEAVVRGIRKFLGDDEK